MTISAESPPSTPHGGLGKLLLGLLFPTEGEVTVLGKPAHDVTKNDLAARFPPSGRFGANAAWYRLNLLTYNVLTVLKRQALPPRLHQAHPKRLRFEVFTVPAMLRTHARSLTAQLGAPALTVEELVAARGRLRELSDQIRHFSDDKSA